MAWLRTYILFPKRFGIYPYFWLIFLAYPLAIAINEHGVRRPFTLVLLLAFLVCYRNGYEVTKRLPWAILGQLVISIYFGVVAQYLWLFVFTAWQVGSLPLAKGTRRPYLVVYYLTAGVTCLTSWAQNNSNLNQLNFSVGIDQLVLLAFIFSSPIAAISVFKTVAESERTRQITRRVENFIRQNERQRISQDLHDTLGQSFSMITIKAELARKLVVIDPDQTEIQLADIEQASRENLQLVRNIVNNLRQLSIAEVLIAQQSNLTAAGVTLLTDHEEISQSWPRSVQVTIGAIIQEAITNIIRYAQANRCWITFSQKESLVHVEIRDNGRGIEQRRIGSTGISGMKQRIKQLPDGHFHLISDVKGTTVALAFTLNEGA
ncbi:sensor histidine kinase [Furfurilactobacillus curtus]|uniref:histidine kinase n=1 Tax=Furfurilactobacillus curtus TaxID=1746200 RepID=A0ABQ5JV58_9LACO